MGDTPDRKKIGKVALKKVVAPPRSSIPRDDVDSQFDRSFDATFEIPAGGGDPDATPIPGAFPRPPPGELDLDVVVTAPARASRPSGPPEPRAASGGRPPSSDAPAAALASLAAEAGVPGIDLDRVAIDLAGLDFLPREVAERHVIVPVAVRDDQIFLAMADPSQQRVVDEIEFVTGRQVVALVAAPAQVRRFADACYKAKAAGEKVLRGAAAAGVAPGAIEGAMVRPGGGSAARLGHEYASGAAVGPIDLTLSPLPPPPSPVPKADERRQRVLVVDDENDIRGLIARVLREAGFEVVEAAKGTDALRAVQTMMPDLLVLDAMLPEIHGFDVCRRIKNSERYRHIPVIMISAVYRGWRFAHDLKKSYGVDHFMEKPFKISELLDKVRQHLSGAPAPPVEEPELSSAAQGELDAGVRKYRSGDIDGAIEHLKRGVEIDPLSHRLHYHLGVLYGKQGSIYLAIHEMENAIEIEPSDFATLRSLAQLYEHAGFKFKAVETWERTMSACPDDAARASIKEHLVGLL
ncbi:MAG: response regulator [Myxococcota bacterium]|nr:response regulator [Myxococcota bacterium]